MNHAIPAGDGILVGGGRSVAFPYTPMAFLAKTDASGNLEWIKNLESDNHQDQIISLVPNGDSFTAFTIRGGVRAPEVDRVDGQVDGSGISITPIVANASFQLARSMRIGTSQRILSVGMGAPSAANPNVDLGVMLMHGGTGLDWMRSYDVGNTYGMRLSGVSALADGHFMACGYLPGVTEFRAILMKVDGDGEVVWCRSYTDVSGGAWFHDVQEQANGDLLVCGTKGDYGGLLARLDADGMPLWNTSPATSRLTHFQREAGMNVVYDVNSRNELTADGRTCFYYDAANLTAESRVVSTASISLSVSTSSTSVASFELLDRPGMLSWNNNCTLTGIPERELSAALSARPNPTTGQVQLGEGGALSGVPYHIRSIMGQRVGSGHYSGSIDMARLPAGIYTIELPTEMRRTRVVKQ